MTDKRGTKQFVVREFAEVAGGYYDSKGFYNTPNGSFWDDEGYYFNKNGVDKHGGYYDDNLNYIHGQGWNETNQCYLSELENGDYLEDDGEDFDDFDKAGFENFKQVHGVDNYDLDDYEYEDTHVKKEHIKMNIDVNLGTTNTKKEIKPNEKVESKQPTNVPVDHINIEIDKKIEVLPPRKNKLDSLFDNTPSTNKPTVIGNTKIIGTKSTTTNKKK